MTDKELARELAIRLCGFALKSDIEEVERALRTHRAAVLREAQDIAARNDEGYTYKELERLAAEAEEGNRG